MTTTQPTAVVLFNLGGPVDLPSVEPFLVNLFSDREIIELPGGRLLQPMMAHLIARMRGPSVRGNYARIGGGSPQLRITRAQAAALEERLNAGCPDVPMYRVFISMRYSDPTAADALEAISAGGISRIVTLSLFPQWSRATTGSSRAAFERALADWRGYHFDVTHIEHYEADPGYLDAMAATVNRAFARIPEPRRDGTVILFSAHGLPQKFIDDGDPYVFHTEATRDGILQRLGRSNRHLLAYQSRTGPVKWLEPGTEETLRQLAQEGVTDVLVVPLSFVSDHIETLYEVDQLFAETAHRVGITGYYRSEALNTEPLFIDALARLVESHVSGVDHLREAMALSLPGVAW